jgi:hypothetical protein
MNFYNTPISNAALDIPFFSDPREASLFPHNSERMTYDKDDHRYYLTEAGLSHYGVNFDPQGVKRLIRDTTDHIYSYICLMAQTAYNIMHYRIAKSLFGRNKSPFEGRLEFERTLARQAEFIVRFGNARETPKLVMSPETGRIKEAEPNPQSGFWLDDTVLGWLGSNHLLDPNIKAPPLFIDWSKY